VESSSLWVIPFDGGEPRRLTRSQSSERDPRVSGDGKWLYFSSNRSGSFDLYRAALGADMSLGPPERLTDDPGQELSPSVSPDGASLVYMQVGDEGASRIVRLDLEGERKPRALTQGPSDLTPSWGPSGQIAFARVSEGRQDPDLWVMDALGHQPTHLVNSYYADITGPRWSSDGRYLFAIGVYRAAASGRPILGSVVFVDMDESPRIVRALHDPAAPESRIGVALRPGALDGAALDRAPEYRDSLKQVLRDELLERRREATETESKAGADGAE
jgi:Tol biopolymer transport system component